MLRDGDYSDLVRGFDGPGTSDVSTSSHDPMFELHRMMLGYPCIRMYEENGGSDTGGKGLWRFYGADVRVLAALSFE